MSAREEQVLGKAYDVKLMRKLWPFLRPHARLLLVWLPFTLAANSPSALKLMMLSSSASSAIGTFALE